MLHGVISTYNNSPGMLAECFESISVFDQSTDSQMAKNLLLKFPNLVVTENSGHSLSHYFRYIIDNYYNLSGYLVFLKSNVVPRHIDKKTFDKCIDLVNQQSGYVSFFNDQSFKDKIRIAYHVYPGLFLERNNSWYMKGHTNQFFDSFNQLLTFVYVNPMIPEFVPFTPGGCFGVSSSQVRRIPIEVWKFLSEITTYKFFPAEAYLVERFLYILLHAPYDFQPYFYEESKNWQMQLRQLSDEKMKETEKSRMFSGRKFERLRNFAYDLLVRLESKIRFELDSHF